MGTLETTLVFFMFFLVFPAMAATASEENCSIARCRSGEPNVRYPFRLEGLQQSRCGYPGFNLTCNSGNKTILVLPFSGAFLVRGINYVSQEIRIYDADNCLPRRILDLNLSGSPFRGDYYQNYTFFNCSSSAENFRRSLFIPIRCLSSSTNKVWATPFDFEVLGSCELIGRVLVPVSGPGVFLGLGSDFYLTWGAPDCRNCEVEGGKCGISSNNSLEVGCSKVPRHGISRAVVWIMSMGIGLPALMLLICCASACLKAYDGGAFRHSNSEIPTTLLPQPVALMVGLDDPTIESYPKVILGESRRLPKPEDHICPICLSEYQPKETLKSIPDCYHGFHADCIDEWLRRNGSCPVCRSSPASPAYVT